MLARTALIALALLAAAAPAHAAFGPVGTLDQLPGADGCVAGGDTPPCRHVRAITPLVRFAMSPNGSAIVAPSVFDHSAILHRDPATGALSQSPTEAGCVGPAGNSVSCRPAPNLEQSIDAAFSPDGRHVYIVGVNGIASFDFVPDAQVGGLVPLAGVTACHSNDGTAQPGNEAGRCTDGRALSNLAAVAVSPDGAFVYAATDPAGTDSDGLVILSRDPATGALSQSAGPRGCVTGARTATGDEAPASGCGGELRGVSNPTDVAVAPDGTVFLSGSQGVGVLRRDAQNLLHQPVTPDACVASIGQAGCAEGRALGEPFSLAVSPDGASLYVASSATPEVAHLRISNGGIVQPGDTTGCAADAGNPSDGPAGSCAPARSLGGVISGAGVSPDGRTVAVSGSASDDEVALLDRDAEGALSQAADFRGCLSRSGDATGTGGGPGKCYVASGAGGGAFAWTPGGEHFYAGGGGDSSIAFLRREVAPACDEPAANTDTVTPVTIAFTCTDGNGDAVTIEVTSPPQRGTVTTSGTSATYRPDGTPGVFDFGVVPVDSSGNRGPAAGGSVAVAPAVVQPGPLAGKAPLPRAVTRTLKRDRRGRMRFSLACPSSAPVGCKGQLVIRTMKVRTSKRGKRRVVPVLSRAYDIPVGNTVRLTFRPSRAVRRVLKARRLTGLTVRLTAPAQSTLTANSAVSRAQLKR